MTDGFLRDNQSARFGRVAVNEARRGRPTPGWDVTRVDVPEPYGRSRSPIGAKGRKTHRVKEAWIAEPTGHRSGRTVLTRYLCGASGWYVDLSTETVQVCAHCQLIFEGRSEVTL